MALVVNILNASKKGGWGFHVLVWILFVKKCIPLIQCICLFNSILLNSLLF